MSTKSQQEELSTKRFAIRMPIYLIDEVSGGRMVAYVCSDAQEGEGWLQPDSPAEVVECWHDGRPEPHPVKGYEEALRDGVLANGPEVGGGGVHIGLSAILASILEMRAKRCGTRPVSKAS